MNNSQQTMQGVIVSTSHGFKDYFALYIYNQVLFST